MFDVISNISDMRNKCIQNDIKTLCFFVFAFKMSVSKPMRQHTDRTLKEKIEILGKLDSGLKAVDVPKDLIKVNQRCLHGRNREPKLMKWWMQAKCLTRSITVNPSYLKWRGHCIFGFVK